MTENSRQAGPSAPVQLPGSSSLTDAARRMKDEDVTDVLVVDGRSVLGVVTDRDIVIRAVARGRDPSRTTLHQIWEDS
ncbi:MAG: CBS domain-containing protein [Actinomycetota bacterium]